MNQLEDKILNLRQTREYLQHIVDSNRYISEGVQICQDKIKELDIEIKGLVDEANK